MRSDHHIRVNECLLQREELFLRIHAVETEVTRLLGGPFPFTLPDLPSARRTKRPARALSPAPAKPPIALRRLEPGESAYRVTYRQFAKVMIEEHHDFEAVRTLFACQTPQLEIQSVEILNADGTVAAG